MKQRVEFERITFKKNDYELKIINPIRNALNSDHLSDSWYSYPTDEKRIGVIKEFSDIHGTTDIIGWALSLTDDKGKNPFWILSKTGETYGRLSGTMLELITLVRFHELDQDLLKTRSSKQLIKSVTIEEKSYSRFQFNKDFNEIPDITRIPFRTSEKSNTLIDYKIPKRFVGTPGLDVDALIQSTNYRNKKDLQKWGILDINNRPTELSRVLVDSFESWLLFEYSFICLNKEIKELLPKELILINRILNDKEINEEDFEFLFPDQGLPIKEKADLFLRKIGIKKNYFLDGRLTILNSNTQSQLDYLTTKSEIWGFLQPGFISVMDTNMDHWNPVDVKTQAIREKWTYPGIYPSSILIGPTCSGKTVLLGTLALEWINQGKRVATIKGMLDPIDQPDDENLLVIIDDIDQYPIDFIITILSTWRNPNGAKVLATMREEIFEYIFSKNHSNLFLINNMIKTVRIPDWTPEEVSEIVEVFLKFNYIDPEIKKFLLEKQIQDYNPGVVMAYWKEAWKFKPPTFIYPPENLQLKFLRLMSDLFLDDVSASWRTEVDEAAFETYCCLHHGRCRVTNEIVNGVMEYYTKGKERIEFPMSLFCKMEMVQDYYWIPVWKSPFGITLSEDFDEIGEYTIEFYLEMGRISHSQAKRMKFILTEFKKRRKNRTGYIEVLKQVAKRLLKNSSPGSALWYWPFNSLHGLLPVGEDVLGLYPEDMWSEQGMKEWIRPLSKEKQEEITLLLLRLTDESRNFIHADLNYPIFEILGKMALHLNRSLSNLSLVCIDRYLILFNSKNEFERALEIVEQGMTLLKESNLENEDEIFFALMVHKIGNLNFLGRYDEVVEIFERIKPQMQKDYQDPNINDHICGIYNQLARTKIALGELNEATHLVNEADKLLSGTHQSQNLHGFVSKTREMIAEFSGDEDGYLRAIIDSIEKYGEVGDVFNQYEEMKRLESYYLNKDNEEEAELIQKRMENLIRSYNGNRMYSGDDSERWHHYFIYKQNRYKTDHNGIIKSISDILESDRVDDDLIMEIIPDFVKYCHEKRCEEEALDLIMRGLKITHKSNKLFQEAILLDNLYGIALKLEKYNELLWITVDLTIVNMVAKIYPQDQMESDLEKAMKSKGISKIKGTRGEARIRRGKFILVNYQDK